jgi:hypothetical protein
MCDACRVTGATAHHIFEIPMSSGHAPILKVALQATNHDKRATHIHQARSAVRIDKDRESGAELGNGQAEFDSSFVMDGSPQNALSILSGEGLDEVQ